MYILEKVFLACSMLLILSIWSSKASGRFGIPALLIFLGIGMLAGSEGIGGIYFDNARTAQYIGILALSYILFSGGMATDVHVIKEVKWPGLSLSIFGVLITAAMIAYFAKFFFGFSSKEGFILGGIVSATDAAAVFSILNSKKSALKGKLRPLLEFESGSNDPMSVFLTLGFIQLIQNPQMSTWKLIPLFAQQMALGAILGLFIGKSMVYITNKIRLEQEGLYPILILASVLFIYGITSILGGSGFLAVYLAGLIMGNSSYDHKQFILSFHDGISWLMNMTMFLTLGLLVFPSHLLAVAFSGLIFSTFLIFIARPVSIFISLLPFKYSVISLRERVLISWVGLRGAAPIILATFPRVVGLEKSEFMFNVVFFVVLISMIIQGTTIAWMAKVLHLEVKSAA